MRMVLLTAALGAMLPPASQATGFAFRVFTIPAATSVSINAINDGGEAAGQFISAAFPRGTGFIGTLAHVRALSNPGQSGPDVAAFNPTGINNYRTVIGTFSVGMPMQQVFTWHAGKYTSEGGLGIGETFLMPPFLDGANHISYNISQGAEGGGMPFAGSVATQTAISVNGFPEVSSVNAHLDVAGEYQTYIGSRYSKAVFFGTIKHVEPILPPNATASFGGWLNAAGQLAGSYQDAVGGLHGFVFQAGHYTNFNMPTEPVTLTVQGIDATGSVVGAYSDSVHQHGFIAVQGRVTLLGAFPISDAVHVSISQIGKYVAISFDDGKIVRSLIGACKAPGGC